MTEDEMIDARFDEYLERGLIIEVGLDENGERIFSIDPKAEQEAPELHGRFIRTLEDKIIELYEAGIVKISFSDFGEPMYSLTEIGIRLAEESVSDKE